MRESVSYHSYPVLGKNTLENHKDHSHYYPLIFQRKHTVLKNNPHPNPVIKVIFIIIKVTLITGLGCGLFVIKDMF